jgi:hypothetical protein
MRAVMRIVWEWGLPVVFVAWVVSAFVAPEIAKGIGRWVVMPYGAFVCVRWTVRWGQRRYRTAGLRAFVPHKTPWAP